jgi:nicotinamidase-related amidase
MSDTTEYLRSPELMSRDDTALLVIDVQEKLIPLIRDQQRVVWNIRRLLDGAEILGVTKLATEQYPKGLGATISLLRDRLAEIPEKATFSCAGCPQLFSGLAEQGVRNVLLAGIETHVCVQQTALDLVAAGFRVYLAVDATGTRHSIDYDTALRRLESQGVTLTSTESALFEWCETSGTDEFKQISGLIREPSPERDA